MPVTIRIDQSQCAAKVKAAWNKGLYELSSEILADCNEYCKVDQRTLIISSMLHSRLSEGKLIWQTPYAKRQYWTIPQGRTPGTVWKWCETAKSKWKYLWERKAQELMRENL